MPEPTETLRDEFAMAALMGLLNRFPYEPKEAIPKAYEYADFALAEREKSKQD